jgi:hypothetical protein
MWTLPEVVANINRGHLPISNISIKISERIYFQSCSCQFSEFVLPALFFLKIKLALSIFVIIARVLFRLLENSGQYNSHGN